MANISSAKKARRSRRGSCQTRKRRKQRNRAQIAKKSAGHPRLSVFRSGRYIYAQIIDDSQGHTVASASSLEKDVSSKIKSTGTIEASEAVGKLIAERAIKAGVSNVVFDRGGYRYHGRVKALADAARSSGLAF